MYLRHIRVTEVLRMGRRRSKERKGTTFAIQFSFLSWQGSE